MIVAAAGLTAEGWAMVIGAVFLGGGNLLALVLAYRERIAAADREAARILREEEAARKVEAVRIQAKYAAEKVEQVAVAAGEVAAKVDDVKANLTETKVEHQKHEQVAADTNVRLGRIEATSDKIHDLVNSASLAQLHAYSVQLAAHAVLARRFAILSEMEEDAVAADAAAKAADVAEKEYDRHVVKQKVSDEKGGAST